MEKKLFKIKMRLGDYTTFLDVNYNDEWFYLEFEEEDAWASIVLKDGSIYDVHLLKEDKWEVSIYGVSIVCRSDNGLVELFETDTSEEGQQIVELEETIGDG